MSQVFKLFQYTYRSRSLQKAAIVVHLIQNMQNVVIWHWCFEAYGKEMYKDLQRTCIMANSLCGGDEPPWNHGNCSPRQEKRWRLYILPQYLANQTKPTGRFRKIKFNGSCSYTNGIALVEFEWLTIFLYVFIRSFWVFLRKALYVNVPVAIYFLTVDCTHQN